ncbi:hypothetical protein CDAR_542701 [Caerostris darwini]|uniref:Uncharacterized protein n=1 Tax=Caerostris darwini TaxID=1538125 RepID=A0AAV4WVP2_9ARAC|nr:hypothetical protein CDAR_542701 [Caerostris darwini]
MLTHVAGMQHVEHVAGIALFESQPVLRRLNRKSRRILACCSQNYSLICFYDTHNAYMLQECYMLNMLQESHCLSLNLFFVGMLHVEHVAGIALFESQPVLRRLNRKSRRMLACCSQNYSLICFYDTHNAYMLQECCMLNMLQESHCLSLNLFFVGMLHVEHVAGIALFESQPVLRRLNRKSRRMLACCSQNYSLICFYDTHNAYMLQECCMLNMLQESHCLSLNLFFVGMQHVEHVAGIALFESQPVLRRLNRKSRRMLACCSQNYSLICFYDTHNAYMLQECCMLNMLQESHCLSLNLFFVGMLHVEHVAGIALFESQPVLRRLNRKSRRMLACCSQNYSLICFYDTHNAYMLQECCMLNMLQESHCLSLNLFFVGMLHVEHVAGIALFESQPVLRRLNRKSRRMLACCSQNYSLICFYDTHNAYMLQECCMLNMLQESHCLSLNLFFVG